MSKSTFVVRPAAVALMALMAATRFDHFGTSIALPDASLAVFFLASLWLGGRYLFALLLAEAGLIDYLAINQLGVSDFCISPAYSLLILAYGAMWLGGKWCRQFSGISGLAGLQQLIALTVSTSIAFLISNGSFYLLTDKVTSRSWQQYSQTVSDYYPAYLTSSLIYAVTIVGLVALVKVLSGSKLHREAA